MSSPLTPRQKSEQDRRKEITSAHEDRMASFRKSEEAARVRREDTDGTPVQTAPATSDAIADLESFKPARKIRTKKK